MIQTLKKVNVPRILYATVMVVCTNYCLYKFIQIQSITNIKLMIYTALLSLFYLLRVYVEKQNNRQSSLLELLRGVLFVCTFYFFITILIQFILATFLNFPEINSGRNLALYGYKIMFLVFYTIHCLKDS